MTRPRLLPLMGAVAAIFASVLVTFSPGAAAAAGTTSPFTAYVGVGNPAALTALAARTGVPISYATDYFDDGSWAKIDDTWDMDNWAGTGYQMIWGVPMLPVSGATLSDGSAGAYDQYYVTVAKDLVARGMGDSVLRLGWEFNVSSSPWYAAGQASAFVGYWRHIVTAMRSVSGANFRFEWNPNIGDNGAANQAMGDLTTYYPGDAYVDITALDVYDIAWNTYPGESQQFSDLAARKWGLNWLKSFAAQHSKSLSLAEFGLGWGGSAGNGQPYAGSGTVCGGDNPGFVTDLATWMRQNAAVISGFWDYSHSSVESGQNPLTAAAIASQYGAVASPAPTASSTPTSAPAPTPSPTSSPTSTPTPTSSAAPTSSPAPTATPTPPPTTTATATKPKHRAKAMRLTLRRQHGHAHRIRFSGAARPLPTGRKVALQTAVNRHSHVWRTSSTVRTDSHGRYRVVVPSGSLHRYARVIALRGYSLAHSRAVLVPHHHA